MQVRIALKRLFSGIALKRIVSNNTLGLFVVVRLVSDIFRAAEQIAKNLAKPFSDSATTSEATAFAATKALADSGSVTEASILGFGRPLTDVGSAAEADVKSFGKSSSDSASSSDSGTLLNQDYVDNPNYFADDYVGAKRTF